MKTRASTIVRTFAFAILPSLIYTLNVQAQDYMLDFAGAGAATSVDSVKVENFSQATLSFPMYVPPFLTIYGGDTLHLSNTTGVYSFEVGKSYGIKIFPNPMTDNTIVQLSPPTEENAVISVFDVSGKLLAQIESYLEVSPQEFYISGIHQGFYLIVVKGSSYQYSEKLLSKGVSTGKIRIEKNINNQVVDPKLIKKAKKGTHTIVDMECADGDRLMFTGTSGIYSTVITDIPTEDKTITFNFIDCIDGDDNSYPVVTIGNQIWMAQNLNFDADSGCWMYNNDSSMAETHGRLYDWETAQNACPSGWHLPSDDEWSELVSYLIENGYNFDGSTSDDKTAKSLAYPYSWRAGINEAGYPNYEPKFNNATGFSALASGYRGSDSNFLRINESAGFWSATEYSDSFAYAVSINNAMVGVLRYHFHKSTGYSVRCVKDE